MEISRKQKFCKTERGLTIRQNRQRERQADGQTDRERQIQWSSFHGPMQAAQGAEAEAAAAANFK